MTDKHKVLVLTDHKNHSKENALYPLLNCLNEHPLTHRVDVATRAKPENAAFFDCRKDAALFVSTIGKDFAFSGDGRFFSQSPFAAELDAYDWVWLRMPPPLNRKFLAYLEQRFSTLIINNPRGIYETGSKEFLTNFPRLCPPMKVCQNLADIASFKSRFPIVLKPFREYGGKGIVKIEGDTVWNGKEKTDFGSFAGTLPSENLNYLAVKYLKNVSEGDKRIVVVNGKVLGASLRMPAEGSWLCNVAMGGHSRPAGIDEEEREIVAAVNPVLSKMGIVMYGIDTLVGDGGKRVLSEINTTSIGGLQHIAKQQNRPLVEEAIELIWSYFKANEKSGHQQERKD